MSQPITIGNVVASISQTLDDEFPNIPIATEMIEEGLDTEYFFIRLLEPLHERELNKRFRKTYPMVIHYFNQDRSNLDMYEMADKLFQLLAQPKLEGRELLARNMRTQIVDKVLLFFVTYDLIVFEKEEKEKIQSAELEVKVRV